MTGTISALSYATLAFLAIHIIPSSYLRGAVIKKTGTLVYLVAYSVVSLLVFNWMTSAYFAAPLGPVLWDLGNMARYAAMVIMPVAFILVVGPLTSRSPTIVGGQKTVNTLMARSGINAITRHPLMWAIALWAVAHLLNNGDLKSVIFFSGLGCLAVVGTIMIDRKREKELGDDWKTYTAVTSNIPFLAMLQGRADISVKMLWWRVLLGLVGFALFFRFHSMIIGVSPLPL